MSFWDAGRQPSSYQHPVTEFDRDARNRLDGTPSSKPTAEQVRQVYNDAVREDEAVQDRAANRLTLDGFAASHPEVCDTLDNGKRLINQLRTMFGDTRWSVAQVEAAASILRQSGLLDLDGTVVASQERQAAKQNFEAERARIAERSFDPSADYSEMDLDEIRRRANEALVR